MTYLILDENTGSFVPNVAQFNRPSIQKKVYNKQKNKVVKPLEWPRNIQKTAIVHGESYVDKNGTIVSQKTIKPPCIDCKLKCSTRVSEETRESFFKQFYNLDSKQSQWNFIVRYVQFGDKSMEKVKSTQERTANKKYFIGTSKFVNKSEEMLLVCRNMFLNTLAISEKVIRTAVTKNNENLMKDCRGKYKRKLSDIEQKKEILFTNILKVFH